MNVKGTSVDKFCVCFLTKWNTSFLALVGPTDVKGRSLRKNDVEEGGSMVALGRLCWLSFSFLNLKKDLGVAPRAPEVSKNGVKKQRCKKETRKRQPRRPNSFQNVSPKGPESILFSFGCKRRLFSKTWFSLTNYYDSDDWSFGKSEEEQTKRRGK